MTTLLRLLKPYRVTCIVHVYDGIETRAKKQMTTVHAPDAAEAGKTLTTHIRREYKKRTDCGLSGVIVESVVEIKLIERMDGSGDGEKNDQ